MENMENILYILNKLDKDIKNLNEKIDNLESKVDKVIDKIDENIIDNCKKMSEHIDFIEHVYDNVKNPLGYICNKLSYFNTKNYTLENNI
jgi:hypothetical protein